MADRVDYFFRQRVTEAELDLGFALLEKADRDLAADLNIYGIIAGAVPAAHSPVPDLTVDLTAPARAYDRLGQRIFFGTGQTVDCAVDHTGIPTDVTVVGNERWLGIFLRFKRQLSDPRTDGNSQQVFFRRDESFEIVVRQGPDGAIGVAPKPALQADELLVCDVRRRPGQTQILAEDIDTSRRQVFIFAQGSAVSVVTGGWNALAPLVATVQSAFDAVDGELHDHFTAAARRHAASDVDFAAHGFLGAGDLQAAIGELVDGLASGAAGSSGATRVNADATTGTPHALPAGSVKAQLSQLLSFLNGHVGAITGAHHASAIAAQPHLHISAENVQGQLEEIVTDLKSTNPSLGTAQVGSAAISGSPYTLANGTARSQLSSLLSSLNAHATAAADAHAASAVGVTSSGGQLSASNVQAALMEILSAVGADHYRGNEANAGHHKTIRQPAQTGSKALLWDSRGNGGTRFRVYADASSIWFTMNASWTGSEWARDSANPAGGFRLSSSDFEFLHQEHGAGSFTDWSRRWRLPMASTANSAFELSGPVQEVGRLAMSWSNPSNASTEVGAGGSVTFRNRFPATPSSITTAVNYFTGVNAPPTIMSADRDGFGFIGYRTVNDHSWQHWIGTYTATA